MLGRLLFTLVCLVIAAGLVLPLYPSDVPAPRSAAVDPLLPAAGSEMAACEDCSADCESRLLPAAFVAVDDRFGLSVILLIQPPAGLSSERQPLLPRLPAI